MNNIDVEEIRQGVETMLKVNLAVQEGESVLVMTDPPSLIEWRELSLNQLQYAFERCSLAKAVVDLAVKILPHSKVTFLPYLSVGRHGAELDSSTAQKMLDSNVIIALTNYSLSHTEAAKRACERGVRLASMPVFLPKMFAGSMTADYLQMAKDGKKLAQILTEAKKVTITTPLGTSLDLDIEGRSGFVETGLIERGGNDNLPAGEVYIAPLEGRAEGEVVVTPEGYAELKEPMIIIFRDGEVQSIEGGGETGEKFRQLLELPIPGHQSKRRNLAELGIGTNPKANSVESILEAEKIKGTIHIAIGDNSHFGGLVKTDMHVDFVLWEPTLILDDKTVIDRGKWMI
jgi:leucyl aminopeptidase (aminopeptidase T)